MICRDGKILKNELRRCFINLLQNIYLLKIRKLERVIILLIKFWLTYKSYPGLVGSLGRWFLDFYGLIQVFNRFNF